MGSTVRMVQTHKVRNGKQVIVQKYTKVQKGDNLDTSKNKREICKETRSNNSQFYQLDAQILCFNTFITFLYMFRALLCSSSGGQIVLVQPLVSSLSLGDCSLHKLRKDCPFLNCVLNSHLKRVTIPEAVLIQFDLLRMSIIHVVLETCRGM